ncbi:hypothetical protein HpCK35_32200 [Helicobacter pylori]
MRWIFFDASGAVIGSAAAGVLAAYGAYTGVGLLASTAGGVAIAELSGVAATNATLAWLVAGPALAILGALSAAKMEKKRDDAKAYYSQVEAAVKKADVIVDNLQAVRKMADLFTKQITRIDTLFFSLSQDAIATMKKHHYDTSLYNQKEKDQLCVTVSTLSSLSAFLKAPIMDKHQKLNEKALNLMRDQVNALESGNYSLSGIRSRQAQLEDLRDDKTS